jgi:hypothetical protein
MTYLNQGRPVLLIHQPYQRRKDAVDVGLELTANNEPAGYLGSYDNVPKNAVDEGVSDAATLPLKLADAGYRFDRKTIGGTPKAASWIARATPNSNAAWDKTVDEAAAAQRALGLDAIITPSPEIDGAHAINTLRAAIDAARRGFAKKQAGDPPWFARLTLRDEWLVNKQDRVAVLNEVSNLPDDVGIALHVRWRKSNPETDAGLLEGLKLFALQLDNDDRPLILLNSGIIGWLSLAWGVNALSAGLSLASWAESWRGGGGAKAGQPKPPNIKWYFEPALLKRLPENEHALLAAQPSYNQCTCSYCSGLTTTNWQPTAYQHALYALGVLTNQVAAVPAGQRQQRVLALVNAAESNWKALVPNTLSTTQKPVHLQGWKSVL